MQPQSTVHSHAVADTMAYASFNQFSTRSREEPPWQERGRGEIREHSPEITPCRAHSKKSRKQWHTPVSKTKCSQQGMCPTLSPHAF